MGCLVRVSALGVDHTHNLNDLDKTMQGVLEGSPRGVGQADPCRDRRPLVAVRVERQAMHNRPTAVKYGHHAEQSRRLRSWGEPARDRVGRRLIWHVLPLRSPEVVVEQKTPRPGRATRGSALCWISAEAPVGNAEAEVAHRAASSSAGPMARNGTSTARTCGSRGRAQANGEPGESTSSSLSRSGASRSPAYASYSDVLASDAACRPSPASMAS